MATITLNIPDAALPRVVDALCALDGYEPGSGPKGAFAKQVLIRIVKQTVKNHEAEIARRTAAAKADSEVSVT